MKLALFAVLATVLGTSGSAQSKPTTRTGAASQPTSRSSSRPIRSQPSSRATRINPRTGREFVTTLVEGEPMYDILPRDRIRSIDAPKFVSASDAAEFMLDDEPVLGVVGANGTAKCYSAWQLDRHEIVNDRVDGHSIAATW